LPGGAECTAFTDCRTGNRVLCDAEQDFSHAPTNLPNQGPKANENVSINGKAVPAVVGQKLSVVAAAARVQIPYNCRNGECGTCTVKVNSRKVKACQATVPVGDCRIETL